MNMLKLLCDMLRVRESTSNKIEEKTNEPKETNTYGILTVAAGKLENHNSGIDTLRGIAILSVILLHINIRIPFSETFLHIWMHCRWDVLLH